MTRPTATASFTAMSVVVEITGVGVGEAEAAEARDAARDLADAWECRFSRFRPDSLLARLNAAEGAPVPVDATFLALLDRAAEGVRRSGGRFDPAVLPALEAAGYRQSWTERSGWATSSGAATPSVGPAAWDGIRIDREQGIVALPPGMRLDLGGIAKGAFADRVADRLAGWPGGCVSVGGDLVVWGRPPEGDAWEVGIENPARSDHDLLTLHVPAGRRVGIATSGTGRRRWGPPGREAHHLIDPATGRPLDETLAVAATAVAATATDAEIVTKALLVAAANGEPPDRLDAELALLVGRDGGVTLLDQTALSRTEASNAA